MARFGVPSVIRGGMDMLRRMRFLVTVALIAVMLAPGAPSVNAQGKPQGELKIGLVLPFTGPVALLGDEGFAGVDIAREIINERGGVLGKNVVFVKADAPDPASGVNEVERLINREKLTAIIGSYASGISLATTQAAEKNGVFYWESWAAADQVTERGFKYTFRVTPKVSFFGFSAADYAARFIAPALKQPPKDLRVAIVHEDSSFGTGGANGAEKRAKEAGFTVVLKESYKQTTADLSPLIIKLKNARPDIVIASGYVNDATLMRKQAKELGLYVKAWIGLGAGYGLPDFAKAVGDDVNGLFNTESPGAINIEGLPPETAALYRDFRARFMARKQREPTTNSNVGFIGAWTLLHEVIPRAGSLDPDKLREAALKLDLPDNSLINGWGMKFSEEGTNIRARTTMMQWQNGRLVTVFPENLSTGKPTLVPLPQR